MNPSHLVNRFLTTGSRQRLPTIPCLSCHRYSSLLRLIERESDFSPRNRNNRRTVVQNTTGLTEQRVMQSSHSRWMCSNRAMQEIFKTRHGSAQLTSVRLMAGHSKWQNIKATKTAKDKERSKLTSYFTNRIQSVVKETGSADLKYNARLAQVVADAKSKDIPNLVIEKAINRSKKASDPTKIVYIDIRGPAGTFLIVESSTDKPTRTRNDLQSICKKFGAEVSTNSARHAFEQKGMLIVAVSEEDVDMDKYVDVAIEAGAEDVQLETDEEDQQVLRFVCETDEMFAVKKNLEKQNFVVKSVTNEFVGSPMVTPNERDMEVIEQFMEKLEEYSDVLRVFINVQPPTSQS